MSALYCCSQCSFTAESKSVVDMHHKYQHATSLVGGYQGLDPPPPIKTSTPRVSPPASPFSKNRKLLNRTSSATKLLGKIKARICKSRTLFPHPEVPESSIHFNNLSSECTSNALKVESVTSINTISPVVNENKETFACHLCSFDADRITTLDRHLLNHHKIGLENLLKLVMAKTKDGLSDERNSIMYGFRQPYYRPQNEMIQEGEFIIETVTPQIKILKHASTNTEEAEFKEMNLERNCEMISKEIEGMLRGEKSCDSEGFMSKIQTLNECMCKFVNSSNTLKKVLTKERESKANVKERFNPGELFFDLVLGGPETPRSWERAHSDNMERSRNKYGEACRTNKAKQSSESFYF